MSVFAKKEIKNQWISKASRSPPSSPENETNNQYKQKSITTPYYRFVKHIHNPWIFCVLCSIYQISKKKKKKWFDPLIFMFRTKRVITVKRDGQILLQQQKRLFKKKEKKVGFPSATRQKPLLISWAVESLANKRGRTEYWKKKKKNWERERDDAARRVSFRAELITWKENRTVYSL